MTTLLNTAFNSVAGFQDRSDTPKNNKELLANKTQVHWWKSHDALVPRFGT
jgi:hypothetical protein